MNKSGVVKNFSIVAIIAIFSKVFGFLRDALVSYVYGASAITDAFNIVQFLPNFLFMVIHQAVVVGFIPVFLKIRHEDKNESNGFVQFGVLIFTLISSLLCLLLFLFPSFWIKVFAGGFDENTALLTMQMLRYSSWALMLQSVVVMFSAYLNALKKFIIPACLGFILDISVVVCLFLSNGIHKPYILGLAPLLTMIIESLVLFISAFKNGFRFTTSFRGQSKNFVEMLKVSLPSIIALGISQLNYYVDKNISSNYAAGSISSLSLSNNIINAVEVIIVSSLATVLYTEFSKLESENKKQDAVGLMSETFNKLMVFLIPASILIFVCSEPIVRVLYGHGSFNSDNIYTTSNCLKFYSFGMPFLGVSTIVVRYFYSIKKAKYVVMSSILSLLTNILGDVIVWKFTDFGVGALAAVTSLSFAVNCLSLLFFLMKNKRTSIAIDYPFFFVLYGLSFICGMIAYLPSKLMGALLYGLAACLTCAITFAVLLIPMLLFYLKYSNPKLYSDVLIKINVFRKKKQNNTK